jgi:hypothetical protein
LLKNHKHVHNKSFHIISAVMKHLNKLIMISWDSSCNLKYLLQLIPGMFVCPRVPELCSSYGSKRNKKVAILTSDQEQNTNKWKLIILTTNLYKCIVMLQARLSSCKHIYYRHGIDFHGISSTGASIMGKRILIVLLYNEKLD